MPDHLHVPIKFLFNYLAVHSFTGQIYVAVCQEIRTLDVAAVVFVHSSPFPLSGEVHSLPQIAFVNSYLWCIADVIADASA